MTTPTAGAAAAAGFSQLELERRLSQLKESAESVQSLSSWCLKHQHQHRRIVNTWLKVLKRVKNPQRLALFYLANDVIQRSKRKTMDFVDSFHSVLEAAMPLVRDEKLRPAISRILKIWHERSVFDDTFIDSLGAIVENVVKADSEENARIISSFRMDDLVARVRQVEQTEQDTDTRLRQLNLCHFHATNANIDHVRANVKSRAESREFVAELDECVQAVQSYVTALNSELQLRSELIDHLEQADIYYETQRNDVKIVATAYKNFGRRLRELKKKLEEALPSLTDLSPVPSPDVNAPSPTGSDDLLDLPDDETAGNGVTDCSTQRSPVGSLAGQQPQRPADADPRSEMQRLIGRWTADIGGQTETTDEVFQSSDKQDQRLLTASTTTTAAATTATATNSNNSSDSGGGTATRRGPSCDQRLAQLFPGMFSPPAASPAAPPPPPPAAAAAAEAAEALNCSTNTTLHDMFQQQQQQDDVGDDDSSSRESNHLFPACREPIDMARLTANLLGSPSLIRQPTAADHETDTGFNNLHALYDDAADISNHQQQYQEQQAQSDDDEDEDDDDHLVTHIVRRVDARLQQQQQQQQWGVNGSASAWPISATDGNCGVGEGAADLGHMMKSAAAVAIPGLDLSRPPPSAPPQMDPPPSAPPFLDPPPSAPPLLDLPPSSVGAVTSTNVGVAPLFQRAPPPTPVLAPVTLGAASSSNNNSSSVWSRTVDEFIEKLKSGRGVTALTTSASAAKTSSAPINHDTDQRQALHHHSGSLSHHHHQQQHQQQPLPHRDTDAHLSRPTSLSSASSTMSMSSLSPSPVAPRAARDTDYRRHSYHSTASPPPAAAAAAAATQQHNHQQQQQQRPHTEPLLPLPAAFAHQLPPLPHLITTPSLLPVPFAAITTTPFSTTATATPLDAHSSDGSTTTIVKNTNNNTAAASGGDGDGGGVARRELIEYVACLGVFRRIKQEPVDDKDDDGVRAECIPLPGEVSSAATATTTTAIRSEAQQQQQCLGPLPAPLRVRDPPPHLAQSAADDDVHQGGDELDSDQPELVWYGQPDRTPPPLVDIADRPNTPPHTKQHHSRRHHDHHQQQRHRSTSTSRRNSDARHKKRRHHRHDRHRRDSSSTASTPSRTTPSRSDSVHSSSSRDSTPRGTASHSRRPRHSRTSSSRTHRRDRRSHSSHRHHRSRRRRSSSSHHHHHQQQQHRRRRHRNESAGSDSSHDSSAHRHRRTDSRLSRTDESHRHSRHRHREQQQEEQQQQQQQKHRKHSREETSRADADRGKGGVRRGRKRGSRSSGGGSSDSSAGGGGGAARSRRKDDRKRHQNETHRQRRDSGDAPIMASSSSGGRHEYSYSHAAAGVRHGDKHSSRSKRQR